MRITTVAVVHQVRSWISLEFSLLEGNVDEKNSRKDSVEENVCRIQEERGKNQILLLPWWKG